MASNDEPLDRRPPMSIDIRDIAAGGAQPRTSSEGRCIPLSQFYRMSPQTDRVLVWRSIRCDAPGLGARSHPGVKNVSRSFHAHREPRQSTRLGPPHHKSLSWCMEATYLMRLPSVGGGAFAATAVTVLNLTPVDACRTSTENRPAVRFSNRINPITQAHV
jgi:hypothetical protein